MSAAEPESPTEIYNILDRAQPGCRFHLKGKEIGELEYYSSPEAVSTSERTIRPGDSITILGSGAKGRTRISLTDTPTVEYEIARLDSRSWHPEQRNGDDMSVVRATELLDPEARPTMRGEDTFDEHSPGIRPLMIKAHDRLMRAARESEAGLFA